MEKTNENAEIFRQELENFLNEKKTEYKQEELLVGLLMELARVLGYYYSLEDKRDFNVCLKSLDYALNSYGIDLKEIMVKFERY